MANQLSPALRSEKHIPFRSKRIGLLLPKSGFSAPSLSCANLRSQRSFLVATRAPLKGLIRLVADGYSKSGALGDLLLGQNARLLQSSPALKEKIGVGVVLTPVRDLEDGFSAFLVSPPSPVRLFHIRTAKHAVVCANGRAVETYHPGKGVEDLLGDNMRSLFLSLFPDIARFKDFGALAYPRMSKDTLESLTRN